MSLSFQRLRLGWMDPSDAYFGVSLHLKQVPPYFIFRSMLQHCFALKLKKRRALTPQTILSCYGVSPTAVTSRILSTLPTKHVNFEEEAHH